MENSPILKSQITIITIITIINFQFSILMIDLWQEIYGTLRRNKLRTFLTGFAVAWGIFMLIVLLGAGNGLIHAFEQNSSERALNSIRIFPGWTSRTTA